MPSFLNIRSGRAEVPCNKDILENFAKFIEKFRAVVFTLIKFQAKGLQLY